MGEEIKIRFYGNGVNPENVDVRELSKVVNAFADAVRCIIENNAPDVDSSKFYLTAIEDRSLGLGVKSNATTFAVAAILTIGQAIESNNYEAIPEKAQEHLETFFSFTQSRNCNGEITHHHLNGHQTLVNISPETRVIRQEKRVISGDADVFAFVMKAGGSEPKISIRLPDGKSMNCESTTELVQSIKVYDWFRFKGSAVWNVEDYSMISFNIKEADQNKEVSATKAFRLLSDRFGHYFDGENPDDFVNSMRFE